MTRLEILASLVMDSYNQEFQKSSDFFDQDDFIQYCGIFYGKALQDEFDKAQKQIRLNKQDPTLITTYINAQWYKTKKVPVKEDTNGHYIEPINLFAFSNDHRLSSLKSLRVINPECCGDAIKQFGQANGLKFLPKSDKSIYFTPSFEKIRIYRAPEGTKTVEVSYIPSVSESEDDIQLPDGIAHRIMMETYNYMAITRSGKIVDMTNDQNPNTHPTKEI